MQNHLVLSGPQRHLSMRARESGILKMCGEVAKQCLHLSTFSEGVSCMLLILLAASLLHPQQASMECVDTGANIAATETQEVRGPRGATAVLKVSTADDHRQELSPTCMADYKLVVTPAAGGAPKWRSDFLAVRMAITGELCRCVSLVSRQDGKRVLWRILAEGAEVFNDDVPLRLPCGRRPGADR